MFGNAILLLGIYAWLSIGDANAAQVVGTVIYGVSIAFLAIWLYDGTFQYFSVTPRERLFTAYLRTRKDGAVGVDGQTAADYAVDLEGNLRSLLDRAKSGRYQAPPVRRVHIPKGTGSEQAHRHAHVRG